MNDSIANTSAAMAGAAATRAGNTRRMHARTLSDSVRRGLPSLLAANAAIRSMGDITSRGAARSPRQAGVDGVARRGAAFVLAPLALALWLAGCATPPAIDAGALPATPATWKEAATPDRSDGRFAVVPPAEAQPRGEWWRVFRDPQLDALVDRATAQNGSIAQAAARLERARALLRSAEAERRPQVSLGGGAARLSTLDTGSVPTTQLNAGAQADWELDLFGRLARARDAAALDAEAREALLQSTRLAVQADVTQAYLDLRSLDDERALLRETVDAYHDTLRLTEKRLAAGDIGPLDVERVRAEAAATEAEALALDRRRALLEHALGVLVGDVPTAFAVVPAPSPLPARADNAASAPEALPAIPQIPAGLPSAMLARRPDVAAAQRSLLAAQARVGVAQAAWFPAVSLTAQGGYASTDLGDLFQWSARSWGIGALLSLPIFDGGRREAGIRAASADFDGALAAYRDQVLAAFRDVEDQLASLRLLGEQAEAQGRAVAAAQRATTISQARWRNGRVSQLDLLDAQRSELRDRRAALQVRAAQYDATVGLVRALGGSWDSISPAPVESRMTMVRKPAA